MIAVQCKLRTKFSNDEAVEDERELEEVEKAGLFLFEDENDDEEEEEEEEQEKEEDGNDEEE